MCLWVCVCACVRAVYVCVCVCARLCVYYMCVCTRLRLFKSTTFLGTLAKSKERRLGSSCERVFAAFAERGSFGWYTVTTYDLYLLFLLQTAVLQRLVLLFAPL